jgi:hypothetical protein
MKEKLKLRLLDASQDQLLEIIEVLSSRDKTLENEIEFILYPKLATNTQGYYNRFVKTNIDTNSWSVFPNKGVVGLHKCFDRMKLLSSLGNICEARKLSLAILAVTERCKRNYNRQNIKELKEISSQVKNYL